jgi:inward rectifier potassium channel
MSNNFSKRIKEYNNSGFGNKPDHQPERLINQDGSLNVKKTGLSFFDHFSVFHFLVSTNWLTFNLLVIATYALVNLFFGLIYWGIGIENLGVTPYSPMEDLLECIYFSAQTFSTVGYGRANPSSHVTNFIALSEMLVGMMYLALAAGLLFARFSRPVAKIVFSKKALVSPYKDHKGLMIRLSNAKTNLLLDVEVKLLLVMNIVENGKDVRKFYDLDLEMSMINIFALTWTVVHPIDSNSPLFDFDKEKLNNSKAEFMVLVKGYNNTLSQTVHARTSYKYFDVEWDAKFSPIFEYKNGNTIVPIDKIGSFEKTILQ